MQSLNNTQAYLKAEFGMPSSSFLKGIFFSATSSPVFQKSTELKFTKSQTVASVFLPSGVWLSALLHGLLRQSFPGYCTAPSAAVSRWYKSRPPVISLTCAHAHNRESLHTCCSLRVEYLTHTNASLHEEAVCVLLSFQSEWAPCMVGLVCMYLCLCLCLFCHCMYSYVHVCACPVMTKGEEE